MYEPLSLRPLVRRAELTAQLDMVPDFGSPDAALEQYRTPARVAAELLWLAHADGCISGKDVLDLGCGTGMLAKGARLLGATVSGVDVSVDAIATAQAQVPGGHFESCELSAWSPRAVDTVVMNPPFGAQQRGADRIFHDRAAACVKERHGTVWFLQQPVGERYYAKQYTEFGMRIERMGEWDYPLDARFAFHQKAVAGLTVAGYVASF